MDTMRKHGTGSFEHGTKSWRLRSKGIKVSIRQLSRYFGEEIPANERDSLPYWKRYLAELEARDNEKKAQQSPRLQQVNRILKQFEEEGRDDIHRILLQQEKERLESQLPLSLIETVTGSGKAIEHETQYIHPDIRQFIQMGIEPTIANLAMLEEMILKNKPSKKETLANEIKGYVARYKAKRTHKGHYEIKATLDLFQSVTGHISIREITVEHYRRFLALIDGETWTDRTKANRQRILHTFLKRLEADYNVIFSFIRNPDYKREVGEGQKVQYTIEQVKTALANATGINRYSLLMGLNTGAYWGDLVEIKPEDIRAGYLHKARAKLRHKKSPMIGVWKLWKATQESLIFGKSKRQLEEPYRQFREKYNLPEHKGLRKTVTQWIHDNIGEEEARLYRCETGMGHHHRHYVKSYSPEQVRKLDNALRKVAEYFGIEA